MHLPSLLPHARSTCRALNTITCPPSPGGEDEADSRAAGHRGCACGEEVRGPLALSSEGGGVPHAAGGRQQLPLKSISVK